MKSNEQVASEKYQKKLADASLKQARVTVHQQELKLFRSLLALHVYPNLPITLKVKEGLKK